MSASGFHEGEAATQRRAGVEAEARRLEGMLDASGLSPGAARFLASQRFAALTGRDHDGVLWISPLAAPPGFLHGQDDILHVSALPRDGDPLHSIPGGQQVGLIAIDFATRRRLRVNGELVSADHRGMTVRVDQSYGNCPKYIHRRAIDAAGLAAPASQRRTTLLDPSDQALIASSDTFFLGTSHPTRGSDASHRGGPPGFVRVDSPNRLWWPDFPGNNMFNSYGNLAVDDEAALLFIDFDTGAALHVTGTARVRWTTPGAAGDDGGVGRNVAFSVGGVAR
ncbi:pyridoxamine 5'-phosphate oxidase family protein [Mycobacterium nebraskense]|uniref:Pyridoxamine 5'-phosphate oxidase n=1 Tax=Mycobacterium nebraskense TaxID=244292 RepID=A0A0F5N564_9MYCO|nr:pyridoxamine 5'-phosphate oxidase family protein [Mycobacterium nebraskense]KKC02179.1 pyridoxamine 5'-phosphate oxidase [Mycobacterium nebraskense]KLO36057.1 pyridoxamine 5'-phosphate oxidase [Mycobacterium nebraskense]MBI2696187.1 pyridoxamine 5'-phosphate oxidase family protein [Mycobacterium nebraskense]MCV7117088.1 pyridoxamine 5'-phosphate oxidase family protein [Mycobacterium nebraskense]ORW19742.1 pyridoxamine 5'-phosphate oxidase [Mycobacterium nebraskense]